MATDTSQYFKAPDSETVYTSYDSYKQNIGGATPLPQTANIYNQPAATATPPPVDTTQPNPATTNATPYTSQSFYLPETPVAGFDPQTVFNDKGEALSADLYKAQGGAADFSNVTKVSSIDQALAKARLTGNPPQTPAAGAAAVTDLMPNTGNAVNMANIDAQLAADPNYQQLLADRTEYTNIVNQSKTLVDTYKQAITDAGIPGINTDMLNIKNVIDGNEDMIRQEIQAAGGFATEGQVMALSIARNKSLTKNYNDLLNTKQMAMDNINTMMGLASQDKQAALSNVLAKLQIDEQINSYKDKMVSAANEAYSKVVTAMGYSGLVQSLQGDPSAISTVEKSLGMVPGQLQQTAEVEKSQLNAKNAAAAGITTRFTNMGGEFFNTKTGQAYPTPQDFFAAAGVKDFNEAYQKGLVTDLAAATGGKASDNQVVTADGRSLLINKLTGETIRDLGDAYKGTPDDTQKTVDKFNTDVSSWNMESTREQFIRQMQARYPDIEPSDIERKVYETYPNGYDS